MWERDRQAGKKGRHPWRWWKGRDGARIHDPPRLLQRLRHMLVVIGDQVPAGIPPAGPLTYFVVGVEDVLQGLIGGSGKMAGVEVMPQAQMALLAG